MGDENKGRRFFKLYHEVLADLGFNNKLLAYLKMMTTMDHKTGEIPIPQRKIAEEFGLTKTLAGRLHIRARVDRGIAWGNGGATVGQESEENQGLSGGPRGSRGAAVGHTISRVDRNNKKLYPPEFERAWKIYPKPAGSKTGGYEKWQRYVEPITDELFVDGLIDAIEKQKAYKAHMDSSGEFWPEFPMFEKWLKEARWENKPEISEKPSSADAFANWNADGQ